MRQIKTQTFFRLLLVWVTPVFLLISGCSGTRWTWQHPDGLGTSALQQAKSECRVLVENERNNFSYYHHYAPFYGNRYYRYGHYRPYFQHHHDYGFHQNNIKFKKLLHFCLRAKGWQRVKVKQPKQPAAK